MGTSRKKTLLALIFILLLAAGLRYWAAATRSFWYDEAFSVLLAKAGVQGILAGTISRGSGAAAEYHPPTYYFLLLGWMKLFGDSVMAVRALSILFGLGEVFLVYLLAGEFLEEKITLMACLLAALSPFQIQYAAETRMFSMLAFFLLLAAWFLIKAIKTQKWGWWAGFALACAAAQYTFSLAVFFLLALAGGVLLTKNRKTVLALILSGLAAVALYLPWLLQALTQFSSIRAHFWITRPGLVDWINLLLRFTVNLPLPGGWMLPALSITLLCTALGAYQTFLAVRQKNAGYKTGVGLAYLTFAPALLLWLFSQWTPVYLDCALLACSAVYGIWLVWALFNNPFPMIRRVGLSLMAAAAAVGLYAIVANNGYNLDPLKAINKQLQQEVEPGDVIVHSNKLSYLSLFYYDDLSDMVFISDPPGSSTDTFSAATRQVMEVKDAPDIQTAVQGAKRIWFVIYQESIDEYLAAGAEAHPELDYLDANYDLLEQQKFGDILLYLYQDETP